MGFLESGRSTKLLWELALDLVSNGFRLCWWERDVYTKVVGLLFVKFKLFSLSPDVDCSKITSVELLSWGLENVCVFAVKSAIILKFKI